MGLMSNSALDRIFGRSHIITANWWLADDTKLGFGESNRAGIRWNTGASENDPAHIGSFQLLDPSDNIFIEVLDKGTTSEVYINDTVYVGEAKFWESGIHLQDGWADPQVRSLNGRLDLQSWSNASNYAQVGLDASAGIDIKLFSSTNTWRVAGYPDRTTNLGYSGDSTYRTGGKLTLGDTSDLNYVMISKNLPILALWYDASFTNPGYTQFTPRNFAYAQLFNFGIPTESTFDLDWTSVITSGDIIQWDGSNFVQRSLASAGVSAVGHAHTESDITDLDHLTEAEVVDHLEALTVTTPVGGDWVIFSDAGILRRGLINTLPVTESQISDLVHYTSTDFDTDFGLKTTTNLTEGTNLYYTQARFDSAFTAKSTTNLSEGTNLYYTQARFDSAFTAKSTTNLSEGTNLYYTDARFDSRLATKTTANLTEGSNLYYTDARVESYLTGLGYDPSASTFNTFTINANNEIDFTLDTNDVGIPGTGTVSFGTRTSTTGQKFQFRTEYQYMGMGTENASTGWYFYTPAGKFMFKSNVWVTTDAYFIMDNGTYNGRIWTGAEDVGLTADRTYQLPDQSGTIALTSDLSSGTDRTNWNTAYSWGDHGTVGYLTSETSHADVLQDGDFASNGLMKRTGAGTYGIVTDNSTNWNTAFGWGDHSTAGYSTGSHYTDSSVESYLEGVNFDPSARRFGHGDAVYGTSSAVSTYFGTAGTKAGTIRLESANNASQYSLIQHTTSNLHIDNVGGAIYLGYYDDATIYMGGNAEMSVNSLGSINTSGSLTVTSSESYFHGASRTTAPSGSYNHIHLEESTIMTEGSGFGNLYILQNAYFTGSWRRNATDAPSLIQMSDGAIYMYYGTSGTADGTFTPTSIASFGSTITMFRDVNFSANAILDDIANLSDPNDDRILFWDDSATNTTWLDIGTGLSISGTTLSATHTSHPTGNSGHNKAFGTSSTTVAQGNHVHFSDERLKTGFNVFSSDALSILRRIEIYEYSWDQEKTEYDSTPMIGFKAGQVHEVDSRLTMVKEGRTQLKGKRHLSNLKAVDPNAMNALLLQAIRQLEQRIEELEVKS